MDNFITNLNEIKSQETAHKNLNPALEFNLVETKNSEPANGSFTPWEGTLECSAPASNQSTPILSEDTKSKHVSQPNSNEADSTQSQTIYNNDQEGDKAKIKRLIKSVADAFNLTEESAEKFAAYCENNGLSTEDALKEAAERYISTKDLKIKPAIKNKILKELLEKVNPVDFRELAKLTEKETLKNNQIYVLVVEHVLNLALFNSYGVCRSLDFFYTYDGTFWDLVDEEEIKSFLGLVAERMGVGELSAKYYGFKEHLFKQFLATANLPQPEKDKRKVLINLSNGTLVITEAGAVLEKHNRDDFLTYKLPFNYDPSAQSPIFKKYRDEVLPDIDQQKVLAEFLAYVFINSSTLKLEKALILYGTGANGKSVLYEIVRALYGSKNTSEYSLQSLTNDNGYYRAMIVNKLVNYASEISGRLGVSHFKQLVSGEPVEARLPHGKPHIVTDYAKFIFNCNELPIDVEQTDAFFRRFLIIHFNFTIPENKQDKQLAAKIIEKELSGILNWVLEGLKRLLKQKSFSECPAINQEIEQYKINSDSVKIFIRDSNYAAHARLSIKVKELYFEYREFCCENGYKPVNNSNFKKRLQSTGIPLGKKDNTDVAYMSKIQVSSAWTDEGDEIPF